MAIAGVTQTLLQYFGVIRGAAAEKLSTSDLWQRIRDFEAASGIERPSQLFTFVSQARSLAVSQRTAVNTISQADNAAVLTPSMVAVDLAARDTITRALDPRYFVRYEVATVTAEGESTAWYTIKTSGILPARVGDVRQMIAADMIGQQTKYSYAVTGVTGQIQITGY